MYQVSQTKIDTQQVPQTKNQHSTSSVNKISFTRRKINVRVSQKKNQQAMSFMNKNQWAISSNTNNGHFLVCKFIVEEKRLKTP